MAGKPQPELTEGQKSCLRLVGNQLTSKEIARELGISPFTVNQRLDSARKKLGAESRVDAARLFAAFDGEPIYQRMIYYPSAVAGTGNHANPFEPPIKVEQAGFEQNALENAFYQNSFSWHLRSFLSVPPIGGIRHNYPKYKVILNALNIAFYSTITIAMLIMVITGAMRMVR